MTFTEFLAVFAGVTIGTLSATYALAVLGHLLDKRRKSEPSKASHLDDQPATYSSVECYCGDTIPVPVNIEITTNNDGDHIYSAEPDLSMIWLHSFEKHPDAHKEEA